MNKSFEKMLSIQQSLSDLTGSIEEMYSQIYSECMNEMQERKEITEKKQSEMREWYEKLADSESKRIKIIKKKLPWYFTLFNKIESYSIELRDTRIFIKASFNHKKYCYVELIPNDLN